MINVQNEDLSEQEQELFDEENSAESPAPKAYKPASGKFLQRRSSSTDSGDFYMQQAIQARKNIKFGYENNATVTGTQVIQ